ncbi:MAG: 5-oxoprolinase subunit PxpA [Chloroflexi bacterium]|nr:MAG: 5-oxoprolinase subunit PxpA [Chloroflexota bacterium]
MPLITSANIACGGHAGNDNTMRAAIELAMKNGVVVGAHPGYPDRERFGRVPLEMDPRELIEAVRRQIDAIAGIASRLGARIAHVKAHGALYNQAERDPAVARNILFGIQAATGGHELVVFAPPDSAMYAEAKAMGMKAAREGFIDRAYEPDGTLRPRTIAGALVTDPAAAAAQALAFLRDGGVTTTDGSFLKLEVDTLCIHGDTPGAAEIALAVREALRSAKAKVAPFRA